MKKSLLLSLTLVSLSLGYEGCGVDKNEALDSLSKCVYVSVQNKFSKEEQISENGFVSLFSKDVKQASSQTSHVEFKNVTFTTKENLICANVTENDVQESAKKTLSELFRFEEESLPSLYADKINAIDNLLNKLSFVKAVLTLSQEEDKKLIHLRNTLLNLKAKGVVVFHANLTDAAIKITGIDRSFTASSQIPLTDGKYAYVATANNMCPAKGTFEVKKGEITKEEVELKGYPKIALQSNLKSDELTIKLDGKTVLLDEKQTLHKCEGEIPWSMSYADQKKDGTIDLEPGMDESFYRTFVSQADLKKINKRLQYFTKSKELIVNFGYATASEGSEFEDEKRIEINYFKNSGIYKYGYSTAIGTKDHMYASDINEIEFLFDLRVQLTKIAEKNILIGSLPLIPYFGLQAGFDIHNPIRALLDNDDSTDFSIDSIYTIIRGVVGINLLIHEQLGLNINYAHDFAEKEDRIVNVGLTFGF